MFSAPMMDYLMGISSCNRYDGRNDDQSGFTANYINGIGATSENAKKSLDEFRTVLHQLVDSYFQSFVEDLDFASNVMSYRGDPSGLMALITDYAGKRDAASRDRHSYMYRNSFDIFKEFSESMVRKSLGTDYAGYYSKHGLRGFDWKPSHNNSQSADCNSNSTCGTKNNTYGGGYSGRNNDPGKCGSGANYHKDCGPSHCAPSDCGPIGASQTCSTDGYQKSNIDCSTSKTCSTDGHQKSNVDCGTSKTCSTNERYDSKPKK